MRWDEWIGSLDGRPTLWVKHLLCGWGVHLDLHKMVKADDPECFHTHPAYAVRIVLYGGYAEERWPNRDRETWWSGRFGIIAPDLCHRVSALQNGRVSYSLWLRFRKVAPIHLLGIGWER